MATRSDFNNTHERLQAASVAVDQQFLDLACDLAREVLELHPGQPQALHVLEAAARRTPVLDRLIERSIGGAFYLQKMKVGSVDERLQIIDPLVSGRRVLHVGCTDHPVFDPNSNLHLRLAPIAADLHGLDVDEAGLTQLARHAPGRYFSSLEAVRAAGTRYDVLLVPETIEHVANAGDFLRGLDTLDFDRWMITAPCANAGAHHPDISLRSGDETVGPYASIMRDGYLVEEVHPDHKYWFTPYTLANLVESSVGWVIEEAWLMRRQRQVGLVGRRAA